MEFVVFQKESDFLEMSIEWLMKDSTYKLLDDKFQPRAFKKLMESLWVYPI